MKSLSFSLSLHPSIILLFLLLAYTEAKSNTSTNITNQFCKPTTCGGNGLKIRFPFRLTTQPVSCGLQGFELSCSNNNTILHLPSSSSNGDFYVQDISYLHSRITIKVADETMCPVKPLLSLNLTSSKFDFTKEWPANWGIAIVNCTENVAGSNKYEAGPIDCLSDNRNFVFVTDAYRSINMLPSYCSMSQTAWIPVPSPASDINKTVTKFLERGRMVMAWEALAGCHSCEKSRDFCGFNSITNSIICIKSGDFCGFNSTSNSTSCIKNKGNKNIL